MRYAWGGGGEGAERKEISCGDIAGIENCACSSLGTVWCVLFGPCGPQVPTPQYEKDSCGPHGRRRRVFVGISGSAPKLSKRRMCQREGYLNPVIKMATFTCTIFLPFYVREVL